MLLVKRQKHLSRNSKKKVYKLHKFRERKADSPISDCNSCSFWLKFQQQQTTKIVGIPTIQITQAFSSFISIAQLCRKAGSSWRFLLNLYGMFSVFKTNRESKLNWKHLITWKSALCVCVCLYLRARARVCIGDLGLNATPNSAGFCSVELFLNKHQLVCWLVEICVVVVFLLMVSICGCCLNFKSPNLLL